MKCSDCVYFWREEWEEYPGCKWVSRCPGDFLPCEEEESEREEEEE